MKKNRLIAAIFSLFMCFSFFALTACDMGNLKDPTFDNGGSGESGGSGSETKPEENNKPQVATSDYFDGVVILFKPEVDTNEDSFKDGITGKSMKFNDLLDRQISMLADDILYRLCGIYGKGYTSIDEETVLKDSQNENVLYNDIPASYNGKNAIASYDNGYFYDDGTNVNESLTLDLTQVESWAQTAYSGKGTIKNANNPQAELPENEKMILKNFGLKGAIEGYGFNAYYSEIESERFVFSRLNNDLKNNKYKWNWNSNDKLIDEFDTQYYIQTYRDKLRFALSEILLTGNFDINSSFDFDSIIYKQNLSNLSHLGILDYDKTVIAKFIKEVIIGKNNLDYDNALVQKFAENNIDLKDFKNFEKSVDEIQQDIQSMTEEEKDSYFNNLKSKKELHYYKAYDLIVNSIVDQIVPNKFLNTTDAPIYANAPRLATMYISWKTIDQQAEQTKEEFRTDVNMDIKSIIILPKDLVRLNMAFCFFEAITGDNDFYSKININFVAEGQAYNTSKVQLVKIGKQEIENNQKTMFYNNSVAGPDIPPLESNDNTFMIEATDFEEFKTDKKNENVPEKPENGPDIELRPGESEYVYEFPKWGPSTLALKDFTTFNNPFTMVQNGSSSVSVSIDAGENYMELAFEFFEDETCSTPLINVPQFSFGLIDFDFEWDFTKE